MSPIWSAFLYELEGRKEFLTDLLIRGNDQWPDEQNRGRIYELDFFQNIPLLVVDQIKQDWKTKQEIKENEDA